MTSQNRERKILGLLEEAGEVSVTTLVTELAASDMTIRRDLNRLAADGLILRTHGGAMKVDLLAHKKRFENKSAANVAAKDIICRLAAEQIKDGDTIFMDCGSTVFRLCKFIRNRRIKVITNSLPVVVELTNSAVSVNIIGGEYDHDRQAVHGVMAEEHIARYRASKAFLGVDGLSAKGLFANTELEASITQAFAARAKTIYLLCDASKIDKDTYFKFADLSLVQNLITDRPGPHLTSIRKKGVHVITPTSPHGILHSTPA
ncbi:MAG TPA: DeoR/GlpR family DNA-binding transcription regulator [Puia sp.]